MSPVVDALIPIAGVIALGWLLRKTGLVRAELWGGINRLSYQALLPALLFSTISRAELDIGEAGAFLAAVTLGFVAVSAVAMACRLLPMEGPSFTSVFQGSVRWNGFVLLALSGSVFGTDGEALVALVFAPTVPLINVLSVIVLVIWGASDRPPDLARVASRIITNPLIIGCIAGAAANALDLFQTGPVAETARLAGRAALPLMLLSIGAGLDFSALWARPGLLTITVVLKLVVAPLIFIALGRAFGVQGTALVLVAAIGAAPGAAAAYALASEMGGDARLMAGVVTATTLLAFIAMPFWMGIAGG